MGSAAASLGDYRGLGSQGGAVHQGTGSGTLDISSGLLSGLGGIDVHAMENPGGEMSYSITDNEGYGIVLEDGPVPWQASPDDMGYRRSPTGTTEGTTVADTVATMPGAKMSGGTANGSLSNVGGQLATGSGSETNGSKGAIQTKSPSQARPRTIVAQKPVAEWSASPTSGGGSTGSVDWWSIAGSVDWWSIAALAYDKSAGVAGNLILTGEIIPFQDASISKLATDFGTGANDGAAVYSSTLTLGYVGAERAERVQREAVKRGDYLSQTGFIFATAGGRASQGLVIVAATPLAMEATGLAPLAPLLAPLLEAPAAVSTAQFVTTALTVHSATQAVNDARAGKIADAIDNSISVMIGMKAGLDLLPSPRLPNVATAAKIAAPRGGLAGTRPGGTPYWNGSLEGSLDLHPIQNGAMTQIGESCGPNAVTAALQERGIRVTEGVANELYAAMRANGMQGTRFDQLLPILEKAGLNAEIPRRLTSLGELETFVGHPLTGSTAIVNVFKGDKVHTLLVEGFTQRNGARVLQILDSNEGARFFVPVDEFAERFGMIGNRGAAILLKP